ncbi:uncharacterized protein L969DRAFT_199514 [Mixia osmundae IAM 14324]|nr:uncharacterized protein L969DRAFT_199514 [Mixia osmundae IAM 14324]KEI37386.1 hypothetical protein L969DRAFT_199514 [Mixia osmundae IAM 14324]
MADGTIMLLDLQDFGSHQRSDSAATVQAKPLIHSIHARTASDESLGSLSSASFRSTSSLGTPSATQTSSSEECNTSLTSDDEDDASSPVHNKFLPGLTGPGVSWRAAWVEDGTDDDDNLSGVPQKSSQGTYFDLVDHLDKYGDDVSASDQPILVEILPRLSRASVDEQSGSATPTHYQSEFVRPSMRPRSNTASGASSPLRSVSASAVPTTSPPLRPAPILRRAKTASELRAGASDDSPSKPKEVSFFLPPRPAYLRKRPSKLNCQAGPAINIIGASEDGEPDVPGDEDYFSDVDTAQKARRRYPRTPTVHTFTSQADGHSAQSGTLRTSHRRAYEEEMPQVTRENIVRALLFLFTAPLLVLFDSPLVNRGIALVSVARFRQSVKGSAQHLILLLMSLGVRATIIGFGVAVDAIVIYCGLLFKLFDLAIDAVQLSRQTRARYAQTDN